MKRYFIFGFFIAAWPGISLAQTKVACIGNSITEGTKLTSPSTQAYPAVLQKLLGTGYQVQNDGVSGKTMLKNGDKPYWTQGKLSAVFSFNPAIVTIKLGTNDTKPQNWDAHNGEFKRDYLAMIDTLGALPAKPRIFLVLPVPVWPNTFAIRDSALRKILVIIKEIAAERALPLIDCNTPFLQCQSFFPDGVHPNVTGADSIARIVCRAITAQTSVKQAAAPHCGFAALRRVLLRGGALSFNAPAGASYTILTADMAGKTLMHVNGIAAGPVTCAIHRGESAPHAFLCVVRIDGRIHAALRSVRPEVTYRR